MQLGRNNPPVKISLSPLNPLIDQRTGGKLLLTCTSRRDVPPERLYKVMLVAEKGGIKPGFGITARFS